MTDKTASRAIINRGAGRRPKRARSHLREPILLKLGHFHGARPVAIFIIMSSTLGAVSIFMGTPLLTAIMTAYIVGIMYYLVQRQEQEFDNLRPILTCDPEGADRLKYKLRYHRRSHLFATWLIGPILMIAVNIDGPGITALREGAVRSPSMWWGLSLAALFWILACQLILITYSNSKMFASLGVNLARIDLLDTGSLVPFARVGIRNLLIYFGAYALLPLIYLDGQIYLPSLLIALVVTIPFAIAFLLVPMYGVRGRIAEEKRAELDRIQNAMHGNLDALHKSPIAVDAQHVGFTGLLLYRQMIQDIREWPIDVPVLVRLAVYIVIPLMTWFGAAIVERIVAKVIV